MPRPTYPEHRWVSNHLLAPLSRVTFLLRMSPDRVGPAAFQEWVRDLRAACLQVAAQCDEYLRKRQT